LFQRAVNQITSSSLPNPNIYGGRDITDIVTTEEDGNLSISTAMLIFRIHSEAIGRSVKLSPSSELYVDIIVSILVKWIKILIVKIFYFHRPKFTSSLFHVLLDSIGKQYLDTALDT